MPEDRQFVDLGPLIEVGTQLFATIEKLRKGFVEAFTCPEVLLPGSGDLIAYDRIDQRFTEVVKWELANKSTLEVFQVQLEFFQGSVAELRFVSDVWFQIVRGTADKRFVRDGGCLFLDGDRQSVKVAFTSLESLSVLVFYGLMRMKVSQFHDQFVGLDELHVEVGC